MLIDLGFRGQAGKGRAAGGHAHDGADRSRRAGIDHAPLSEHGREGLHHRPGDLLVLVPADLGQVAHAVLHIVPEGLQIIQQGLSPRGQVSLLPALGQHIQNDGIGIGGIGIAGAVPAIMADVNGLVPLRNGRGSLGRRVDEAVQAGGLVPVGADFFPYA